VDLAINGTSWVGTAFIAATLGVDAERKPLAAPLSAR
jgi:hypothetical protein